MERKVSFAYHTGKAHALNGVECQDAVLGKKNDSRVVLSLADGGGSFEKSAIGANIAVSITCDYFLNYQRELSNFDFSNAVELAEKIRAAISKKSKNIIPYSCTLIAACMDSNTSVILHIGDGVVFRISDNITNIYSHPENGSQKNETFFITYPDYRNHLRLKVKAKSKNEVFLLTTDGCGSSLVNDVSGEISSAVSQMAEWILENDEVVVSKALKENLNNVFAKVSKDDLSIGVITGG